MFIIWGCGWTLQYIWSCASLSFDHVGSLGSWYTTWEHIGRLISVPGRCLDFGLGVRASAPKNYCPDLFELLVDSLGRLLCGYTGEISLFPHITRTSRMTTGGQMRLLCRSRRQHLCRWAFWCWDKTYELQVPQQLFRCALMRTNSRCRFCLGCFARAPCLSAIPADTPNSSFATIP